MHQSQTIQDLHTLAPARVLRVYGMRRSGNHAIVDWMMRNAPEGPGLFLNNCKPNRNPLKTASGIAAYEDGVELTHGGAKDKIRATGATPFTVVSFEDRMPDLKRTALFEAPETCVIIYRSFLHWAASLLRKIQGNAGYGPLERMRVMMQALRTYGEMLGRVQEEDIVPVCYDDWAGDESYRRAALDRLDLPGRDLDLGAVQRYGGGSSFQGKKADTADLATGQRAALMADDLEYQLVLWTAARDLAFMQRLSEVFPQDAERLSALLNTAKAEVTLQ